MIPFRVALIAIFIVMYKLDNNDIDDETNNSVSLTSLLEFLDPIASKVVSKYYHGSHPSKAEQKLRNFEGFRRRKPHHEHDSHHPHHLNRSRSFLQLEDFKVRALQRIRNLDKPLDSIFLKTAQGWRKHFTLSHCLIYFHRIFDGQVSRMVSCLLYHPVLRSDAHTFLHIL